MATDLELTSQPRRRRRVLIMLAAALLLLAAFVASRQLTSRTAIDQRPAAEDCEKASPPESFTLAECDADEQPSPQRDQRK
jgi:hypothetical protein